MVTTLVGLVARIGKLERQHTAATMPTAADLAGVMERAQLRAREGLAALLAHAPRPPRDLEQECTDRELLERCLAGKDDLSSAMGMRRLLLETRLEQMRTRLLEDQAEQDGGVP